jgi:hypothetical protein
MLTIRKLVGEEGGIGMAMERVVARSTAAVSRTAKLTLPPPRA